MHAAKNSRCRGKRRSFSLQKTAFCRLNDRLLLRRLPSFAFMLIFMTLK